MCVAHTAVSRCGDNVVGELKKHASKDATATPQQHTNTSTQQQQGAMAGAVEGATPATAHHHDNNTPSAAGAAGPAASDPAARLPPLAPPPGSAATHKDKEQSVQGGGAGVGAAVTASGTATACTPGAQAAASGLTGSLRLPPTPSSRRHVQVPPHTAAAKVRVCMVMHQRTHTHLVFVLLRD